MARFPVDYLKPYEKSSQTLNVVVETPKGSQVKYAYQSNLGLYVVSKVLPRGMIFPYNFGFVPGTLAPDGDPIDMLILNEESLACNTLLTVHPLAVIKATQVEVKGGKPLRNDRLVGETVSKELPLKSRQLTLDRVTVNEIGVFFQTYNRLYGKKFQVIGLAGSREARKLTEEAVARYRHQQGMR